MLSEEEHKIMQDGFRLIRDHDESPRTLDPDGYMAWWRKFASDTLDMIHKHNDHDLAKRIGMAIYNHVEYDFNCWRAEHETSPGRTGKVDPEAPEEWR